ncbi:unnamed protein product [Ectocarpus sp. CCAP 1310/34]|nr:unnamed protein product [Ectocarpus sp. CCAP 1310/34]
MDPVAPLTPPPPRSATLPPRTPPAVISSLLLRSPASQMSLASAARGSVDPAFASPLAASAAMAAATAADESFSGGAQSTDFAAVAAAAAETIFRSATGVLGDDDGDSATPTASATTPATTTGVTATVADEPIGVAPVPVSAGHDQALSVATTAATMSAPTPLPLSTAIVTNLLAAATTSPPPMMPIDLSSPVTSNESVGASATGTTGVPDLSRREEVLSPPTDACCEPNHPDDAVASPMTSAAVGSSNNNGASTPSGVLAAARNLTTTPTPSAAPISDAPAICPTPSPGGTAAAAARTSPPPASTVPLLVGTTATAAATAAVVVGAMSPSTPAVPLVLPSPGSTPKGIIERELKVDNALNPIAVRNSATTLTDSAAPTVDAPAIYPAPPPSGTAATTAAAAAAAAGISPTPVFTVPLLAGSTPTAAAVAVAVAGSSPTTKSTAPLLAGTTCTATTAAAVVVDARSPSTPAITPVLPSPRSAPKGIIECERKAGSASNTTTPSSSSEKEKQKPPMRFHDAATAMASPARPLPGYANAVKKGRFQSAGATAVAATDAAAATTTTPLKPSSTKVQETPARRTSTDKGTATVPAGSGGAAASRIGTSPPPTGAGAKTTTRRASQGGGAVSPIPSRSSPVHTVSAASVGQRRSAGADCAAAVAAVFGARSPLRRGGVLEMVASVGAPGVLSGTAASPAFLQGSQPGSSSLDEVADAPGARRLSGVSGVASPSRVGGVNPGAARSPFGSILLNRATSSSARASGAAAASASSPVGRPAGFTLDKENPATGGSHAEEGAEKRLSTVRRWRQDDVHARAGRGSPHDNNLEQHAGVQATGIRQGEEGSRGCDRGCDDLHVDEVGEDEKRLGCFQPGIRRAVDEGATGIGNNSVHH